MTLPPYPRGDEAGPPITAHPCAVCGWDRADQPILCRRCVDRARTDLESLPALVATASAELMEPHAGAGQRVSGSRERPLPGGADRLSWLGPASEPSISHGRAHPLGQHRDDQIGDAPVAAVLAAWVRQAVADGGWLPPRPRADGLGHPGGLRERCTAVDVPALASWLGVRHEWACRRQWALDYADELAETARAARRYAGRASAPAELCQGVWCPDCDAMALYRRPGRDGRYCDRRAGGCGLWIPDVAYERWVRLSAWYAKEAG